MKKKIKIWMLIYTVFFFVMLLVFVHDDIQNHYKRAYIAWALFMTLLATCGNMMYALGFIDKIISTYWKVIGPLSILQFILSGIIDMEFSPAAGSVNIYQNILIWTIGVIIFFPTFWANMMLGYKKERVSMNDVPSIKKKRPALVWAISIFYILSAIFTCLSFYILLSGKIPLQEQQRLYLSRLTTFDYAIAGISIILNTAGAISLFLLRRIAFYIFAAVLAISTLITIWSTLTKDWFQTLNAPGIIGAIIGYVITLMICVYAWNLKKEKILT